MKRASKLRKLSALVLLLTTLIHGMANAQQPKPPANRGGEGSGGDEPMRGATLNCRSVAEIDNESPATPKYRVTMVTESKGITGVGTIRLYEYKSKTEIDFHELATVEGATPYHAEVWPSKDGANFNLVAMQSDFKITVNLTPASNQPYSKYGITVYDAVAEKSGSRPIQAQPFICATAFL